MNLTRLSRLLELIGLLQAGKGHNVKVLAAKCEVSRRTIFRDLSVLREAGVPLQHDDECQTYHLDASYLLPPTNFTASEALAMLVFCHELGSQRQLPFFSPAHSAAVKLESTLPAALRKQVRGIADAIKIHLQPANPQEEQSPIYQQLLDAIAQRHCVRIQYDSFSDRQIIRTSLCTYRMLFSRHSWYAIGRSSVHRAVRTFNVARILKLEIIDDTYSIPRNFTLDRYLGNAWHLIREPGPDRQVLIRFSKRVAGNVAEVAWHKTQRLHRNPDGTLDFRVNVSGLKEISWWILGYGDQAEVLEPPDLRNLIMPHAQQMLEHYQPSSGPVSVAHYSLRSAGSSSTTS